MAVMLRQQFKYNILSIVIFGGGRKIGSIRFTYLVVVSRRWMLVESMGVASGCTCSCKEVYRFPHIIYSYILLLYLFFFAAASLIVLNVFSYL